MHCMFAVGFCDDNLAYENENESYVTRNYERSRLIGFIWFSLFKQIHWPSTFVRTMKFYQLEQLLIGSVLAGICGSQIVLATAR